MAESVHVWGNPPCIRLPGLTDWYVSGESDDGWAMRASPLLTSTRLPRRREHTVRYWKAFSGAVAVAAVTALAAPVGAAEANVTLTRVSSDTFTSSTSQHATAGEPDTFAHASTGVGAI